MSELTRLRSSTSDPAEADALLAASGGRFAFASEPDAGFSFEVDQIVDPSFSVARYTIGGEWETSGEFEDFCIVSVTDGAYRWEIDGTRASATRAPFLIRPGHDFMCEAEGSDIVNVYLSPATLRDVARTTFGDEHLEVVFDSASTLGPSHSEYMLTAATVAAEYMDAGTFRHPLVRASLFHTLALAALKCFPLSTDPREKNVTPAGQLSRFRRGVRFIEDHASLPITVLDVAEAAGATMAQLDAAFRTHASTSARGYLQRVRLSAAHDEIAASDPATDLVELAARWGFPDVERFSRRYRSEYGEAPGSALLR
ncbi:AraC family transcriptional regulator [Leifsonia sp. C5G2]|uniref:helix-turn-helix transcriptional regulator n=1 Tax=Leifsonia sp. C5G2 TaxID=2735269 RepID=UPI00158453F2|nr:AraC family transcriptional regulator [Leifsonia sp. C5G2]NUU07967.1 helix-turn-helix transcriptional regulator [Leifsonia sp. C5G2]